MRSMLFCLNVEIDLSFFYHSDPCAEWHVLSVARLVESDMDYLTEVDFYQTQVNLGSDSWVRLSLSPRHC